MRRARYQAHRRPSKTDHTRTRIYALMGFAFTILLLIIIRLFQIQVLQHSDYSAMAQSQHSNSIELAARRGDIYVQDPYTGELSKLATNTTLDLIYVDPIEAENKPEIAQKLTPLLFTEDEYESCKIEPDDCHYDIIKREEELEIEAQNQANNQGEISEDQPNEETDLEQEETEEVIQFKDYNAMLDEISNDILTSISKTKIDFVPLKRNASPELINKIEDENLTGIFINKETFLIYADPTQIPTEQLENTATILAQHLDTSATDLALNLSLRDLRYVPLKNKLDPAISDQVEAMELKGVVLIPEHWRFYPEGDFASHLIGFVTRENIGSYGIEGHFNSDLEGRAGSITAESDPNGRQITVGDTEIINPVDGDSIVLTIDRVVQKEVEEILERKVQEYQADSGQVIIMKPYTGEIVAMANYPSFDPNNFGESYTLRKMEQSEINHLYSTAPVFIKNDRNEYVEATTEEKENESIQKYVYENRFGDGVFKNKAVTEFYEPGSVFKPLVMSIAIDSGEMTPESTFDDYGELEIAGFPIKNSDEKYHGITTMTQVLEKSLNTGMVRVAQALGPKLMHDYLKNYGFGEYTNIRLEGEENAELEGYNQWSVSEQYTRAYGQGIVATPLQVVTAWAAMANGGKLVQPHIVKAVIREGEVMEVEPEIIHRVISEDSSAIMSSMLVSVVHNGHGQPADVPGYLIAGKTGTSQVASTTSAGYATGPGSTITSFAGFFPAMDPEYVMLVKFDRPRSLGDNTWGSTTAAPTFGEIATFMLDYYNIPPTES